MLEKELETAIRIARVASETIMGFYDLEIIAEEKYGIDNFSEPVTIADRTSSKIIVESLQNEFPEDGILSEEEIDVPERLDKSRVWIIDPIDGTKGFINRDGDFAVQIGLAENGVAVLGIVLLPAHNRLYYAVKGEGAFLVEREAEPKRLHVSDKTKFSEMSLAVSRNHPSPKMKRINQDLNLKNTVQRGSVGLKVGLITEQICDLYIHLSSRTKYWDTCAPQIILEEAGGRFTDIFGDEYRYDHADVQNHNGLIASNGVSHEKVVAKLKPLLTNFGRLRVLKKTT